MARENKCSHNQCDGSGKDWDTGAKCACRKHEEAERRAEAHSDSERGN